MSEQPVPALNNASAWNRVPALVRHMPAPDVLLAELKARIQEAYYAEVKARGPVHVPEDTFAMQRKIGGELDRFRSYQRAFGVAIKLLAELQQEELVEAVGEQDGIPNQPLTIPDSEGDIRLSLDAPRVYEIDVDQLVAVLSDELQGRTSEVENLGLIHWTVQRTVEAMLSWGKFEPQVSKVRTYAATLARNGDDQAASIVSGAVTETNPYKGVKFERKRP